MKSDTSIRNICVAAIKRSTIKPYDFSFTCFFDTEMLSEIDNQYFLKLGIDADELPIAQTIIDPFNWTLVTTRQVITCNKGIIKSIAANTVTSSHWGNFKGYGNVVFTTGTLFGDSQQSLEIFIEAGRASMVNIRAIMTLTAQLKAK